MNSQIKQGYADAIAQYLARGGSEKLSGLEEMARTAKQIVDQTQRFYLGMGYKHIREVHGNLYESQHPTEQLVWNMACMAQQELTATDPMDALSELEEDNASE